MAIGSRGHLAIAMFVWSKYRRLPIWMECSDCTRKQDFAPRVGQSGYHGHLADPVADAGNRRPLYERSLLEHVHGNVDSFATRNFEPPSMPGRCARVILQFVDADLINPVHLLVCRRCRSDPSTAEFC